MSEQKEVNISEQNIQGVCDLKCAYNFKYLNSNVTATNNNSMILISYDKTGIQPVTYNNIKYDVSQIILLSPSKHLFDGNQVNAELIIEHTPLIGGKNLFVGIPIIESGNVTTASTKLSEIIASVATKAPNNGESVNMNLTDFTLQDIIPKKPFYNYSISNEDWIVFGRNNAIALTTAVLQKLSQIIQPSADIALGGNIFYNSRGPNSFNTGEDEIYISCQPTGSSEEKTEVTNTKNQTTYDISTIWTDITSSPIFLFLLGSIIFIIILMVINMSITYLSSSNLKSSLSTFTSKMKTNR
jgi:carbonic anhydrase